MKLKTMWLCLSFGLLSLLLLTGCVSVMEPSSGNTEPSTTAKSPLFLKDGLPKLDGSTANIPLAKMVLQRVCTLSDKEIEERTTFSTTPNAYMNLVGGNTDFLLIYEADEETKAAIKESGVELEYHAIGKDALVFLANEGNRVQTLTTKQIQDIYQGKITNWKTVGGEDLPIVAYQRAAKSGSQALMVKLVMKNLPLMKAPTELYPLEMGGLIDAMASYNNSKNAIGYSVYYYARNMYTQPGLRFMAVDGVEPSNKTIADGSYPFVNEFYAVIRKNEPENSSARQLLDWMVSEQGTKAVADAGYVGLASNG